MHSTAWSTALFVALGGGAGSLLRYAVAAWFLPRVAMLPWPTFVVNVLGCFLMGGVHQLLMSGRIVSHVTALTLTTGFLGGFTTFSAFGLDAFKLLSAERLGWALAYVLGTVILGLLALLLGVRLMRLLTAV